MVGESAEGGFDRADVVDLTRPMARERRPTKVKPSSAAPAPATPANQNPMYGDASTSLSTRRMYSNEL